MSLPEVPDYYDFRGAANTRPITPEEKEELRLLHDYEEGAPKESNYVMGASKDRRELVGVPKYIDALVQLHQLPLVFTLRALLASGVFARNNNEAVVLLLDCLTTFERETVTVDKLSRLYLFGFYSDELVRKILASTSNTKSHPWHFILG